MIGWFGSAIVVRKTPGAVALELGADERDVFRRIEEAVRGAVDRE